MAHYTIDNTAERIDFECNSDDEKRTIQNAKNLLMLKLGELPYDRLRGFDTKLFDMPITRLNGEKLMREIDRLMAWEPDAVPISAKATLLEDGPVKIECVIDVNV